MIYRILWLAARVVMTILMRLSGGLRVEGLENVPKSGPLLVAPNHLSFSDPPVVGLALPRPAWFMATSEIFGVRFLGWLARVLHAYPVVQDSPDRGALRKTEQLLARGEAVVVFPEGHVSPDGRLLPVQPGSVMVALHSGATVLPVAVAGTELIVPHGATRPRRAGRPVVVRFGTPIPASELSGGLKGRKGVDEGVRRLESALRDLSEEARQSWNRVERPDQKESRCAIMKGTDIS